MSNAVTVRVYALSGKAVLGPKPMSPHEPLQVLRELVATAVGKPVGTVTLLNRGAPLDPQLPLRSLGAGDLYLSMVSASTTHLVGAAMEALSACPAKVRAMVGAYVGGGARVHFDVTMRNPHAAKYQTCAEREDGAAKLSGWA
eukprot:TRINITY_DN4276_c0_g1_i2.p1 TRINITY_DN4276_c0_g1~~TRINITY_DN4276_c0_g1_i2.p1  ORF type:complete len:143 (-),score=20.65 TRINITY_DN4276_c0_g1_i2:257-685(-)